MTTSRLAACLAALAIATLGTSAARAATTTPIPSPVSVGHAPWGWGSPTPQGQDLDALAFSGTTGYAVGEFGAILSTTDAGTTWTGLPSPTTETLDLVQELSPTTVVVAGGCSALESTDSGSTFTALPLGLGASCAAPVTGIAFSDAEHGYVVLRDGTLDYTADGGRTIEARSPVPVGTGTVTGLAFTSPTTGLAVTSSGLIEQTTDGGNSWIQVKAATGAINGITVVSPTQVDAVGDDGLLLESGDGGSSWTQLPLTLAGGGAEPDLHSITCVDATDCLISTTSANELVSTADGGQTGSLVSVSNKALTAVAYAGGTTVVGVGALGATVISDDGGQTFPTVSSSALISGTPSDGGTLVAGGQAGTAYLTDESAGAIAATSNTGRSWSLIRVPTSQYIGSVAFPTASTGYALDSAGVLRRTANAGSSWRSFPETYGPNPILAAPSASTVLLVGPVGVRRSTNGGSTFSEVRGRVRKAHGQGIPVAKLTSRAAVNHGRLVIAFEGRHGAIAVSDDAGATWRAVPPPPGAGGAFESCDGVSARHLWVDDVLGLYVTTDGGRHWQPVNSVGHAAVYDADPPTIAFSSARDGILSVSRTAESVFGPFEDLDVLRTSDGGRTWVPEVLAGGEDDDRASGALALGTGDIWAGVFFVPGSSNNFPVYFTTAGVPAPTARTRLTVRFARGRVSARALARAHHRVLVTGRISPVPAQAGTVAVSLRSRRRGRWSARTVRVASNGAFRLHIADAAAGAEVVAQALGTSTLAGAGTPVSTLTVTR